jgi:3-keto-5-aminohexanoate cleavage enzyme
MALAAGGGVRVGLEDNIWLDPERTRLARNSELVGRLVNVARSMGQEPYSQTELRDLLKI